LKNGGAEASKQTFKIGRLLKHSGSFQLSVKKLLVSHYDAAHFKKCLPLFHPIGSKANTDCDWFTHAYLHYMQLQVFT